ncbi:hypothetical protein [Nocardioides kribbensis]|uniref:hypothetical protein n=1 Tax=Nocardioides kribbensis TaxID=305517 RepID=UPI0032DB341D
MTYTQDTTTGPHNGLGTTEAPGTGAQAQHAASTAADETRHVASVAGEEAGTVAAEARAQARSVLDDAVAQATEQSRTQRDRLVTTLHGLSDDLDQMASSGTQSGLATEAARQVSQRARSLGTHLDGREPSDLLDDVRGFARRRPGVFLAGALAAGVVTGRLLSGARASGSPAGPGSTSSSDGTADPVLPRTTPGTSPVVPPSAPAPVTPATTAAPPAYGTVDPLTDPLADPLTREVDPGSLR